MNTEQEKYLEALHKAHELKKAIDDLKPETKERLFKDLFQVATMQELRNRLWAELHNHGMI